MDVCRLLKDVQAAQISAATLVRSSLRLDALAELVLANSAESSGSARCRKRALSDLLNEICLGQRLVAESWEGNVNKVNRVASWVSDHDHPGGDMVDNATGSIGVLVMWKMNLLNDSTQGKIPQLQSMVLLHANKEIPQGSVLHNAAKLIDEDDGRWPRLLVGWRGDQSQRSEEHTSDSSHWE